MLRYLALRVMLSLGERLPERAAFLAARGAMRLLFSLGLGPRKAIEENLRVIMGARASQRSVQREARQVYANLARYYVDIARLPLMDQERFDRERVDERGYYENMEPAIAEGHGVILVSGHVGLPEPAIQAVSGRGQHFVALVEEIKPERAFALLQRYRGSLGNRFAPVSVEGVREALKEIRRGGVVVILADRDIQGNGKCVEFFGRPARMPMGAFELSQRTGAVLIPGFATRLDDRRWSVDLQERIVVPNTGDREADVLAAQQEFCRRLETAIRKDPGQWFVAERFWRRCDPGPV